MTYSKQSQTKSAKKKKRRKSTPRQLLEKKLDKLSSAKCREQEHCTICKKSNCVLNAHHYKSRKYKGVRWYQPNLVCLCVHCHTFGMKFSAHKTPEAFKKKMLELKGKEWHEDIELKAREHISWKMDDLKQLLEEIT